MCGKSNELPWTGETLVSREEIDGAENIWSFSEGKVGFLCCGLECDDSGSVDKGDNSPLCDILSASIVLSSLTVLACGDSTSCNFTCDAELDWTRVAAMEGEVIPEVIPDVHPDDTLDVSKSTSLGMIKPSLPKLLLILDLVLLAGLLLEVEPLACELKMLSMLRAPVADTEFDDDCTPLYRLSIGYDVDEWGAVDAWCRATSSSYDSGSSCSAG